MTTSNIKRKLVAILAADAVGYSRQMGENEERTVRVLAAHRAVIDGIIAFHEGRIVGTAGDSVLAEFASPVEALRCAVAIQDAIKTRNDSLPEAERMQFRIGVNLGDVMVKGEDLLGDGVNVAARLESIAEPGGICISSSVYDQIAGKLDLGFVEIGEQNLKNIPRPIRVYRVSGSAGRPVPARAPRSRSSPWIAAAVAAAAVAGGWLWQSGVLIRPEPMPATRAQVATVPEPAPDAEAMEAARAAEQHAKAELAKARADAEIARAQAEAAELRRKAAADLAAAREEANKIAAKHAPRPAAPEPAYPVAAAQAQRPAPAAAWLAVRTCDPIMQMPEMSDEIPVSLAAGEYVIEKGTPGQPGYFVVRGAPGPDGSIALRGEALPALGAARGRTLPASYEGRLEGDRFNTKGRIGRRPCSLTFPRRAP